MSPLTDNEHSGNVTYAKVKSRTWLCTAEGRDFININFANPNNTVRNWPARCSDNARDYLGQLVMGQVGDNFYILYVALISMWKCLKIISIVWTLLVLDKNIY